MARKHKTEFTVVPGTSYLTGTRVFDASPEKVFRALTEADLIEQWWGPRRFTTKVDVLESNEGGRWRFLNIDEEGNEYGFHGVMHEVTAPSRLVRTFEFEGMPGHVALESMNIEPEGDGTRINIVSAFGSVEARDGMVDSGMEEGASETYERLDELLETL